jgi:hypothetical protein
MVTDHQHATSASVVVGEARKEKHRTWNIGTRRLLAESNSNLTAEHSVVVVFYVANERDARLLTDQLTQRGFEITKDVPLAHEDPENWSIEATIDVVPDLGNLNAITDSCVDIEAETGANFDGWYTQPVD